MLKSVIRKGSQKICFEAARLDFDVGDWSIMEEVSLKEKWFFEISPRRRRLMTKPMKISRYLVRNLSTCCSQRDKEKTYG